MISRRLALIILTLFLCSPGVCFSDDFYGKIMKTHGSVYIRNNKGVERTPEASDYIAINDEAINTRSGGKAVVKFTNGSMTVIGENSCLGIEKPTLFRQLKGKVLFAFTKTSGPTRMVQTDSAVFAVRATYFVVEKNENNESLALKEGLINVEAPRGAFEIHKKKEKSELDAFKAEMEEGVREMKKEGEKYIQKEMDDYVAFKQSFLVKPNQVITLKGNRVDQGTMGSSEKASFRDLEDFAGDLIKDYKK